TPWLQIGRAMLEGRTASIPIRVASIPAIPGETLKGTVQVASNGNQRFTVEVELTVAPASGGRQNGAAMPVLDMDAALAGAAPSPPVLVAAADVPLALEGGREFESSRPASTPVLQAVEPVVAPATPASVTPAATPYVGLEPTPTRTVVPASG